MCIITKLLFAGALLSKWETVLIVSGVIVGLVILLSAGIAVRKYLKQKICRPIMKEDINDTYGDYSVPDPVVEMVDSNQYYYTGVYEADTTMTRDNNSQYGN